MAQITRTSPHAKLLQVTDQAGSLACFNCVIEDHQTQADNLARRMLSDWALVAVFLVGLFLRWPTPIET